MIDNVFSNTLFIYHEIVQDMVNYVMCRCFARFGRRLSLIAYYAVSAIALILAHVIPEQAGTSDELQPI